ncbi:hypothetical protein RMSM_01846 [Rhodopirellula maiorica SM1]|uniref:Putative zinc-ribbon domain-containing protein n=2 Tax=Novipirellula TaxID=2795426 RepID=M5RPJ0_9BACT|nr:hypothetical protein RMSM_01846 [Rhodopirellula maiorica SM1]
MSERCESQTEIFMDAQTNNAPLNHVPCPHCGKHVDDRAVACPQCGEKIYVEHPADITPTRHSQIDFPGESNESLQPNAPEIKDDRR